MARSARSPFEKNPLRVRLAALRHRLRVVVTTRGVGWLLTTLLLTAIVVGILDWAWHLPPLVRGFLLVGLLSGAGLVGLLFLLRPLLDRMDDLTLALRIEERYPSLNDSLASTIQFLEQAEKKALGEEDGPAVRDSLAMRREAARRAMQKATGCDFNRIIDANGLRTATVLGTTTLVLALALLWLYPARAATAMARLIDPFGAHHWPTATTIELEPYRSRIGKSDIFELRGRLKGVIPANAQVVCRFDGSSPETHEVRVAAEAEGLGRFQTLLRPNQQARNFRFQVRANDAVTEWLPVEVAPAPTLTALQVNLFFPEYTGLSPRTLPQNNGNVDAVAGTVVSLKATASVPLHAAWLEYHPETAAESLSAFLSPLGANGPASLLGTSAVGLDLAGRHEANLSDDRKSFHLRFLPRLSGGGSYSLHLVDDTGLSSVRSYELRLRPDPAPAVALERPSPLREILEVLPGAVLPLRVSVEDPEYGIRSVWLEYRINSEPFRRLPLYDPGLVMRNPAVKMASPLIPLAAARLRPTQHVIEGRLPLSQLRHDGKDDGSPPREGDVITIRALADDFDNVTPDKQPGTSSHVDIRVISRAALDFVLNGEQARIQQDLIEMRQQQRDALRKVHEIENRVARTRTLSPEDRTELSRAEQTQQQIRERLEAEGQESVRGRVERILETLRQNDLRSSAVQVRMEGVERDLERIGREELEQIEAALAEAQKRAEGAQDKNDPAAKALEQAAVKSERQAKELEQRAADRGREQKDRERLTAEAQKMREQAKRLRELAAEVGKESGAESPEAEARARERSRELERLARERERLSRELERIAARDASGKENELLRQAREQKEAARALSEEARAQAEPQKRERGDARASLTEARRRQEEVDKTLGELLQRLEPWSSTREIKREASAILEGQRRLNDEVEAMQQQGLAQNPSELKPEQRARLENAEAAQRKLRERLQELTDKMRRISEDRKASDPATAEEMRQALEEVQKGNASSQMEDARQNLKENQLSKAGEQQREAIKTLEKLVKQMEDSRQAALGRNIDDLRKAERELEELAAEQDELRKKVKEAEKIKDPEKRKEELRKLKREQEELQKRTEDVARRLSGLKAGRAAQTAGQAAKQMEEAVKRLERGEAPEEQQEEALERLDEAADDADRERGKVEDELARELTDRVADVIKRIKERHDRLLEETGRLYREAQERKIWDAVLGIKGQGGDLADSQKLLGEEAQSVAERDLGGAEVFSRQLLRASDAMKKASDALMAHLKKVADKPEDLSPLTEVERLQVLAQRRLQGLLDALKPDEPDKRQPNRGAQRPRGSQQQGRGRPGDGIPPMAQLKLLRSMQAEVNERTKELSDKKADPEKLTEEQRQELQALQREQRAIADLIEEYTRREKDQREEKK